MVFLLTCCGALTSHTSEERSSSALVSPAQAEAGDGSEDLVPEPLDWRRAAREVMRLMMLLDGS